MPAPPAVLPPAWSLSSAARMMSLFVADGFGGRLLVRGEEAADVRVRGAVDVDRERGDALLRGVGPGVLEDRRVGRGLRLGHGNRRRDTVRIAADVDAVDLDGWRGLVDR